MLQLRKGDVQDSFDIVLQGGHLVHQALPLAGKFPKIQDQGRCRSADQGVPVRKEKLGDDPGVLLVRLGLAELHLDVIGNQKRIEDNDGIPLGSQKRKEIHMVGRRRFHSDENRTWGNE